MLTDKEEELVEEVKKYRLEIAGLSLTKKKENTTVVLQDEWQLFYSSVEPPTHAPVGDRLPISPRITDSDVEWKPINERITLLRLQLPKKIRVVIRVYAPNAESGYSEFLDNVSQVMKSISSTNAILTIGDFNIHVGNDSTTRKGVIDPNGNNDLNPHERLLLGFCSKSDLSITNSFLLA